LVANDRLSSLKNTVALTKRSSFLFTQRYETPQGTILPPLARTKSIDEKRNIKGGPVMDFQATKESLRAGSSKGSKLTPLADTQKKQEQKSKEAAEYRARILKQTKQESHELSPSFGKDKAAIKASKKDRSAREERLNNIEGKATSTQCAFNLANILMVSINHMWKKIEPLLGSPSQYSYPYRASVC
jgi:hypothetical protein